MTQAATVAAPIRFTGVGLHTGAAGAVEIRPADCGAGVSFLTGGERIPATADYASESPLATVMRRNGAQISTVEHVLSVPELDVFDGLVVKTHRHDVRFVDRDQVTDITTTVVHTTVADDEVASLPAPSGPLVLHPDTAHDEGPSLTARWGRLFGRERWKELE